MTTLSRRQFMKLLGVGAIAVAGDSFFIEPQRLTVSRQVLQSGGGGSGKTVRFVQFSDLHISRIGRLEGHLAETIKSIAPDFAVITGDSLNSNNEIGLFSRFLDSLPAGMSVYAVPGNWEHKGLVDLNRLDEVLRKRNGRLLINETVRLHHQGIDMLVTGLDDHIMGNPDLISALKGMTPAPNHLILTHSPGFRRQLQNQLARASGFSPQFILAGHTHGGQITLFGFAPYLPVGSGGYKHGWYGGEGPRMFVSRGVGTTLIPARFMAPPELVYYEWRLNA